MRIIIFVISIFFIASIDIEATKPRISLKHKTIQKKPYTENYTVLSNDTSIREGKYELKYKGKTIEKGQYHKGKRIGDWEFRNFDNKIELCYDYNDHQPFNIMPHEGTKYDARNFPPIFLGSPLIPYHFFAFKATLPQGEIETHRDCKVIVALEINAQGRMTGYHLIEKSEEIFNNIVDNIAQQIPKDWEWVPSRKNGKNVAADYLITIVFDIIEHE